MKKILWFEITTPSRYKNANNVLGGWQDSLENIVRTIPDVELSIAFIGASTEKKEVDGVDYYSMNTHKSVKERIVSKLTGMTDYNSLLSAMHYVIDDVKPDIIHVFGTEWPFGLIATKINIPVVIHIQGALVPYNNALYPPSYSFADYRKLCGFNLKKLIDFWSQKKNEKHQIDREHIIWKNVRYYMGRTDWDRALSGVLNHNRLYFHVDEALRPNFLSGECEWKPMKDGKIRLFSTGCTTFWKGPDMMIKVARILKDRGLDFEWNVAGYMPNDLKKMVENHESTTFEENNINLLGFTKPDVLIEYLSNSTLYVHTAYVENSPNSICEAQCVGLPIVSTNVGGISTLVKNMEEGILVPANDPWQMAYHIISLSGDEDRMRLYSENGKRHAISRHDPETIKNQLLTCYKSIIKNEQN